jgi:hypothetical protein
MPPFITGMPFLGAVVAFVADPFRWYQPASMDAFPLEEFQRRADAGRFQTAIQGDRITMSDPELGCEETVHVSQRDRLHEQFQTVWLRAWEQAEVDFQTW